MWMSLMTNYDAVSSSRLVNGGRDTAEQASVVLSNPSSARSAIAEANNAAAGTRFDYYVARYEVVATVGDMEQLDLWGRQAPRSIGQSLSIHIPQLLGSSMLSIDSQLTDNGVNGASDVRVVRL